MYNYTVQFEFRLPGVKEYCVWRGNFTAKNPFEARDKVVTQLKNIGLEVGDVAVYVEAYVDDNQKETGLWLVLGSVTSTPYNPSVVQFALKPTVPAPSPTAVMVPHAY